MLTTYYGYEIYQYEDDVFHAFIDGWVYESKTLQECKSEIREWVGR
jgi:hypothetical protein